MGNTAYVRYFEHCLSQQHVLFAHVLIFDLLPLSLKISLWSTIKNRVGRKLRYYFVWSDHIKYTCIFAASFICIFIKTVQISFTFQLTNLIFLKIYFFKLNVPVFYLSLSLSMVQLLFAYLKTSSWTVFHENVMITRLETSTYKLSEVSMGH